MRIALAVFLALHGFAHFVGFAGSFGLAESIPYKTTILGGTVDLGDMGIRAFGALWLLAGGAFLVASAAAMTNQEWWLKALLAAATFSLVLSLMALPEARIGVLLDVLILATAGAWRMGWIPASI
ncbi:MAG: ABC transporter permease [Gemmatimonadota bacterium]